MNLRQYIKENRVFLFFAFLFFFPTIRVLTIGSQASQSAFEFLISALPDLFLAILCLSFFIEYVKKGRPCFHFIDILLLLYISYNLLYGFIRAGEPKASLFSVRMTYLPMIFYFLSSFSSFANEKVNSILEKIFRFAFLIAVLGLIIYFFFPEIQTHFNKLITDLGEQEYFIVRMTSIFWTPVVFGVVLAAAIVFWHYRFLVEGKNLYLFYIAVLFISVCLSVSRGPIISVGFGAMLMCLLRIDWKNNTKVLAVLLGSFLLVTTYINNPVKFATWMFSSTKETFLLKDGNTRAELVRNTWRLLEKNPMGVGLGKAGHVAVQRFDISRKDVSFTTTDGWYLKLLVESGYPSLVFYLGILLTFVTSMALYLRIHTFDWMWFILVFAAVVSIQNIVSNVLDFYLFADLYWFIIGLGVYYIKKEKYGIA